MNVVRRSTLFLLALAGCSERHYLSVEDAGALDAGAPPDAGTPSDVGPDVWHYDAGPERDARPTWFAGDCRMSATDGWTGDPCTSSIYCEEPLESSVAVAYCGPDRRLIAVDLEWIACSAPVDTPWTSCEAAFDGGTGQSCAGEWHCARPSADRCCVEIAACNPSRIGGSRLPPDTLMRTRACSRGCATEPAPDRPTRTECPGRWMLGDPEISESDACTGEWACLVGPEAFLSYPGDAPGFLEVIPIWCDGTALHLSPVVSPATFPPPRCEVP
jgi:hypothetical protein